MESTTEAYCETAMAESNTRRREHPHSKEHYAIEAIQSRMRSVVLARKEQEAAARAIDEAGGEAGGVAEDSDDDSAPSNGFDDILINF